MSCSGLGASAQSFYSTSHPTQHFEASEAFGLCIAYSATSCNAMGGELLSHMEQCRRVTSGITDAGMNAQQHDVQLSG